MIWIPVEKNTMPSVEKKYVVKTVTNFLKGDNVVYAKLNISANGEVSFDIHGQTPTHWLYEDQQLHDNNLK